MDIQQQKQFKVLLIGETCEDEYVYGTVDRISPEAPVPVLSYERTETSLGMSANVKKNLESFGVFVNHITNKNRIIKRRIVDKNSNQQLLRIDDEDKVDPLRVSEVKSAFLHMQYDAVVISDYDKGYLTTNDLEVFCQNFSGPVFIDTKKTSLFSYPNVFFKINQKEYSRLLKKPDKENLIITLGENGASYMDNIYFTEKVNVFDVVGAGDTFLSALTYAYLRYQDITSAIVIANKASAIAVQNYGCYVLTESDIEGL
jgi:D-beta-D-heptose 7-phosphate kinase/D-beta-D-heptose 1-phosphate adenosyltransferase